MRNLSILFVCVLTGCGGVATTIPGSDADVTQPDGSVNPDSDVSDVDAGVDAAVSANCLDTDTDTGTLVMHKPIMSGGQFDLDGEGSMACGQPDFSDGRGNTNVDNGFYNTSTQYMYPEMMSFSGAFTGTQPAATSVMGHGHIVVTFSHLAAPVGNTQIDDPCVGVEIHTYSDQNEVGIVYTTGSLVAGHMDLHVDAISLELPLVDAVRATLMNRCRDNDCVPTSMHMNIGDVHMTMWTNNDSGVVSFQEMQVGGYIIDSVAMYEELQLALGTSASTAQRVVHIYDVLVQNNHIVPCTSTPGNALSVQFTTY